MVSQGVEWWKEKSSLPSGVHMSSYRSASRYPLQSPRDPSAYTPLLATLH